MADLAKRFVQNPLLLPKDIEPSRADRQVICLLNPGVFTYQDKTWILVRVAESMIQKEGVVCITVMNATGNTEDVEVPLNDPDLIATDARIISYKGLDYLTTLSHLRLLCSDDGIKFQELEEYPPLFGKGYLERYGIEDCRVTQIDDVYYLTYTAVSDNGVGVGLRTTSNWQQFEHRGMVLPPHNKDCTLFDQKINGLYYMLHRPSSVDIGGNFIWLASSADGLNWGDHQCLITTRPGKWDGARVGGGSSPIKTDKGWLAIYHGADEKHRYCLGAFLMDMNDPSKVLARTIEPIMVPTETYELSGFFGFVVFTNGHLQKGDELTIYYGAADEFVCGATFSVKEILDALTWF